MIFAVIGHAAGDASALQAVLNSLAEEGVQVIVNTGDSAVGGPDPNRAIELLRAHQVTSVQGDLDRLLVRSQRKAQALRKRLAPDVIDALTAAYDQCGSREIEYLRSLPRAATINLDGVAVAVYHGSYTSQSERLTPETPDDVLRRQREIAPAAVHVLGGGPEPFMREVDDTLFVNPGWVGGAPDERVHYALVSTETDPATGELRTL